MLAVPSAQDRNGTSDDYLNTSMYSKSTRLSLATAVVVVMTRRFCFQRVGEALRHRVSQHLPLRLMEHWMFILSGYDPESAAPN
jgi:hypothetical protein